MHKNKYNLLIIGSNAFLETLGELKHFLKFNLIKSVKENEELSYKIDILGTCKEENKNLFLYLSNESAMINPKSDLKTLVERIFTKKIQMPISINDLNNIVIELVSQKNYQNNSQITINEYVIDKNSKKLIKNENFIFLTEKEIQLLELLKSSNKSLSKIDILKRVWKYNDSADTHTVETHIYRLRKKVKEKFSDSLFIKNDKLGYAL